MASSSVAAEGFTAPSPIQNAELPFQALSSGFVGKTIENISVLQIVLTVVVLSVTYDQGAYTHTNTSNNTSLSLFLATAIERVREKRSK